MKLGYLAGGLILLLAFAVSGCTPEQRCKTYEKIHAKAIADAKGDAGKINVANIVYAPLKAACAAQGITIN